jgi:hypothetical protein
VSMRKLGGLQLGETLLEYDCPRCGDSFACASEEDVFAVTTHRLLHQAWKRSRAVSNRMVERERALFSAE